MPEQPNSPNPRTPSAQIRDLLGVTDEPDNMDLLGAFTPAKDEEDGAISDGRGLLLTSAWMVGIAIVVSIGFVTGLLWGIANEPDLGYSNVLAELAIKTVFALACGLLGSAIVVAVAAAAGGAAWIKRRKG